MALLVCSCAHKSGHGERKSDKKVIGLNNKREIIQPKKDREDDIPVKRIERDGRDGGISKIQLSCFYGFYI